MTTVGNIAAFLERYAPRQLAEDWDNVGLLAGDSQRPVRKLMTCLTITPDSADEAVREAADLVVVHHPLPFRPLQRLTTESTPGRLLLQLLEARIAIYSPHTAFDSAAEGINHWLASGLGLCEIQPLVASPSVTGLGSGRWGKCSVPTSLQTLSLTLRQFLRITGVQRVGSPDRVIRSVAVGCGSAGQFLAAARQAGCELLVTGETNFHTCLEAEATGTALLLPGHFASERFAVERLAERLATEFPELTIWASRDEHDPLQWDSGVKS